MGRTVAQARKASEIAPTPKDKGLTARSRSQSAIRA
jgi:hypothetical protein